MKKRTAIAWLVAWSVAVMMTGCGGDSDTPPAAFVTTKAGSDKTVHVGSRVQLDATGSITESDWVYHFKWTVVSKPSGSAMTLTSTTATAPSFTADKVGEYVFDLNVTADEIGSAVDQVKIIATNTAPTASGIDLVLDVDKSTVGVNWRTASSAADADGDSLSISVAADGTYGTCTLVGDNLTYLKNTETKEVDHCTLAVTDGHATANIAVNVESLYWAKLSSRENFTAAIKSDGTLWAWGANLYGQLGDGTTLDRDHSVQEQTHATDWVDVAAGVDHIAAIKSSGTLWSWGRNNHGQLGDDSTTDSSEPVQENMHSTHWAKVVAGNEFTVAKTNDGRLMSWGYNGWRALGIDATTIDKHIPTEIDHGLGGWEDIAAGTNHVMALKTNGQIWSWGDNQNGQLGDNSTTTRRAPVQEHTGASDWAKIFAGGSHSLAIKNNGSLYGWGRNSAGQLGVGNYTNQKQPTLVNAEAWADISVGQLYTMGIQDDGSLYGWGDNEYSQRGDTNIHVKNTPIQIGTDNNWKTIEASKTTTMALKTNGVLYGWGYNKFGQLGNKKTDTQYTPLQIQDTHTWKKISIGWTHALAIRDDGTLWGWGGNGWGQLGNNQSGSEAIFDPVQEHHGYTDWTDVAAGTFFSVALRTANGTLWTWGSNSLGKLGLGGGPITSKHVPTQVDTHHWVHISAGANHAAAIRSGTLNLYAWGYNGNGQLGVGDYTNRDVPTQEAGGLQWKSVSCGHGHTVAIKNGTVGTLYAWGYNHNGQLGIGNTDQKNSPRIVSDGWQAVAAGKGHTIGIKTNGALYGWGHNNVGQVGNGTLTNEVQPNLLSMGPWGIVAAGGDTSMAMKGDDTVWVWGDNANAQHAREGREVPYAKTPQEITSLAGTQATLFTSLSVSSRTVGLVKNDKSLWSWGANDIKLLSRDWYTKEPARLVERH